MRPPRPHPPRNYREIALCLGWLAARSGRPLSPDRLLASLTDGRETRSGFDMEGLTAALRRTGLALEPLGLPRGEIGEAQLPCFVFADARGESVIGLAADAEGRLEARVFSGDSPDGEPADPGLAREAVDGHLYRISPLPEPPAGDDLDTLKKARGHWFWSVFAREGGTYAYVVVAAVATNVIALASSLYVMTVYDRVIPNNSLTTLWTLTIGCALIYAFDLVFRLLRGSLVDIAARRLDVLISRSIFDHLLDVRLEFRRGSAGTMANMLKEFNTVHDFFSSATLLALVDLPFAILFMAIILLLAPPCFWVVVAAVPVVLLAGAVIQFRLSRLSQTSYVDGQEKFGSLVETVTALEAVRALGAERTMRRRWREKVGSSAMSGWGVRLHQQLAVNIAMSVQQLTTLGVVVAGVLAIEGGALSQGALIAAVMLSGRAIAPMGSLAQIMSRANLTRASMKALDKFFDTPAERPLGRAFLDRPAIRGAYELRELSFAYPGNPPVPVLQALNLTIRPGERVAILGRVGSGKSTLLKLLIGLFAPSQGSLRLDGVDLRQIDPAQLRAQVAYVPQAPVLFSGTVRENIAIARPEASDAEVLKAAGIAGADAFIRRHPLGYDMPLGERGEGLSTGQRQAIAIAQALIKQAEVWLMDEPTSAMDDRTELEFCQALEPHLLGKTLVLVTHKPSMLELVDRLVIIDAGRVVMDGPKELVLQALRAGQVRTPERA
ncbi:MAG: type I secretion system permease/ATPase [Candidatus Sericytochromatia bacterium]|nr:type I secretion system permease/ATPase [Candidatus Sericytochromatia bacterium]